MENKNLKVLLPAILIVVLVAIFLLSQLGARTSRRAAEKSQGPAGLQTKNLETGALPQPARPVRLGNLNTTPITGNVDDIVGEVLAGFQDDSAIASEGNTDSALVTTDDSSINQLIGGFNERQF